MTTVSASGLIGRADLVINTDTNLGTVGVAMTVNVCLTNRTGTDCLVRIAFSDSAIAPAATDYIDYDVTLFANRARERGGIACKPNENIWVRASAAGVSARAHGVLLP